MNLILWRHAEAHPGSDTLADLDRPLTAKGIRQAKRMAEWLNGILPQETRVLCSPALRAQETCAALGRRFKTVPSIAPTATTEELLAEVRWPSGRDTTMIVGHQPTLGLAAAYLMGCSELSAENPWKIKKGAVWWLKGRVDEQGRVETQLVVIRSPDML